MRNENENLYLGIILLLAGVIAILGLRMFDAENKVKEFPHCMEDEYLYPEDYIGESSGWNDIDDYVCVPFENGVDNES